MRNLPVDIGSFSPFAYVDAARGGKIRIIAQSIIEDYFLMAFASLIAAIHWFDYFAGHLPWMSPLYNSVPLIVLTTMAVLSPSRDSAHKVDF